MYLWVFFHHISANIPMRFGRKGDFISESLDPDAADSHNSKTYNQLLIDLTTSVTVLLAIFFPSCTGINLTFFVIEFKKKNCILLLFLAKIAFIVSLTCSLL